MVNPLDAVLEPGPALLVRAVMQRIFSKPYFYLRVLQISHQWSQIFAVGLQSI